MNYNLANLAPADKDQLLTQLLAKYDADQGGAGAPADHPDAPQDASMLEPFAKVLEILIDKVESIEDRVGKVESMVIDDLFGGIQKLYDNNQRSQSIDGLKGKYGDLFAPHMDGIAAMAPGEDVFSSLHDLLSSAKGSPDWSDDKEGPLVQSAADSIGAKLAQLKGLGSSGSPADGELSVTKVEAAPVPAGDAQSKLLDKVRAMKAKSKGQMGF